MKRLAHFCIIPFLGLLLSALILGYTRPTSAAPSPIGTQGLFGVVGPLPAFPGATGYGSATPGGRGGRVIEVTNLNDSGAGSLRAALTASGPRVVVFRIGGTIKITSNLVISNPYITIAGQTAPGGGIAIIGGKGFWITTHDVIVRDVPFRRGPGSPGDNLWVRS